MARRHFCMDMSDEHFEYFAACARIRDVSMTGLFRRLAAEIASAQLVQPILDDQSKTATLAKAENSYRAPKPRKAG
jgi:hypothetical protein